jgi:hypothetical protein
MNINQQVRELRPKHLPTSAELDSYERNIIKLINQTHQATIADVVRIIEERQNGWLGTAEDGSDRHPHYDELQVIIEAISSNKE